MSTGRWPAAATAQQLTASASAATSSQQLQQQQQQHQLQQQQRQHQLPPRTQPLQTNVTSLVTRNGTATRVVIGHTTHMNQMQQRAAVGAARHESIVPVSSSSRRVMPTPSHGYTVSRSTTASAAPSTMRGTPPARGAGRGQNVLYQRVPNSAAVGHSHGRGRGVAAHHNVPQPRQQQQIQQQQQQHRAPQPQQQTAMSFLSSPMTSGRSSDLNLFSPYATSTSGGSYGSSTRDGRGVAPAANSTGQAGMKGIPSLHTACIDGNLRMVQYLVIQQGADVNVGDIVGSRPLHVASCYGHIPIIQFLLEAGADLDGQDNFNSSALVVTTNPDAVELLVSHGAQIDIKNVNNISARSVSKSNPYVALAIKNGLKKLLKSKQFIRDYLLDLHSPIHQQKVQERQEENAHLSALSALTTLSTPQLTPTLTPFNSLSPVTGPLTMNLGQSALDSSKLPKLELTKNFGGAGSSSGVKSEDASAAGKRVGLPELAITIVLEYLYPPFPKPDPLATPGFFPDS